MKTWLGLTFCLCFLSAWVYSQPNTTLYYDLDGKKCEASYALFSLTAPANQHVEGYYTNGKSFFRGSIARLDTANFYASKFVDSCVWYYKNGKQKLVRNYDKTGLLEGISREYYESGSLWKEMNYSHNAIENNTYAEFLEDGQRYEIFEDNFNDNQSDWDLLQNESQDVKIADGHLVLTGKTKEAEAMIQNLSNFYRTSLSSDPLEDVTLAEEVELQRLYLEIESVRYPKRLRVKINIPDALMGQNVPALILQPLVENAIKHGVSRTTRPVEIIINAKSEGDVLVLCVVDDGEAMDADHVGGSGIGLANVRDRLEARYRSAARLDTKLLDGGGFIAMLTLPLSHRIAV
jgi:two-component sensor histidine kinase